MRAIAWAIFGPILALTVAALIGCMVLREWISDLTAPGEPG
jgi:hypothetical protein